jgi:hypothetical protein
MDLQQLQQLLLALGGGVNRFASDVSTATAPGALSDLPGFAAEGVQKFAQGAGESTQRNAAIINALARGMQPNMAGVVGEASNFINPIAGVTKGLRPLGAGALDAIQAAMQKRGQPTTNLTDDVMRALGEGGVTPAPRTMAPRAAAPAPAAPMRMERTGKTFTPAPEASSESYAQQLLSALKSYQDPAELIKAKGRLQPALQIGPGAPSAENLMIGSQSAGHGPLYEAVQGMPGAQMTHGYVDPMTKVFLNDALNTMLYDPEMLTRATGMLEQGTPVDSLMKALGFAAPAAQ